MIGGAEIRSAGACVHAEGRNGDFVVAAVGVDCVDTHGILLTLFSRRARQMAAS